MVRANSWSFAYQREKDARFLYPTRDWEWRSPGMLSFDADQQFIPTKLLPAGRVMFSVEPSPLVNEGPFVFEFYEGEHSLGQVTLSSVEKKGITVPWPGGTSLEDQLFRVRVTSTDPALGEKLQESPLVYRLLSAVRFEPNP